MSKMSDTGGGNGDSGHNYTAGVNSEDQEQLYKMVASLRRQNENIFGVFATVGSAALAADTLEQMGYAVRHRVLAVEVDSSSSGPG